MVWLLPNIESKLNSEKELSDALKQRITKKDLIEIINKQHFCKYKEENELKMGKVKQRYTEDMLGSSNLDESVKDFSNTKLKLMTIKKDFNHKSKNRLDRNQDNVRLFARSSNSPLQTLPNDTEKTMNSIHVKSSTWSNNERKVGKIKARIGGHSETPHAEKHGYLKEKMNNVNLRELKHNLSNPGLLSGNYDEEERKYFNNNNHSFHEIKLSELLSNRSNDGGTSNLALKLPEISKFSIMKRKADNHLGQIQAFRESAEDGQVFLADRSRSLVKKRIDKPQGKKQTSKKRKSNLMTYW